MKRMKIHVCRTLKKDMNLSIGKDIVPDQWPRLYNDDLN